MGSGQRARSPDGGFVTIETSLKTGDNEPLAQQHLKDYCSSSSVKAKRAMRQRFDNLCAEFARKGKSGGKEAISTLLGCAAELHGRDQVLAFMVSNMEKLASAQPDAIFPGSRAKRSDYSLASPEFAAFMLGDGLLQASLTMTNGILHALDACMQATDRCSK